MRLDISEVAVGFGSTTILHDVTFSIAPGTMTAMVGVNGAGKSTSLRGIAGVTPLHHGTVTIDDQDIHHMRSQYRAQKLTLVGQEETLLGDLSVTEFVSLGRLPHLKPWEIGGKVEQQIVADSLALVGLTDYADRLCDQLSGGQRRRALLARGSAQGTDVVLLDEPTNHLDVHHQLHLLKVLRESGRTILATIHDLDLAMAYFDQVVVLHEGRMLQVGEPSEVLIPDNLREVFDVQAYLARLPDLSNPHLIIDSL